MTSDAFDCEWREILRDDEGYSDNLLVAMDVAM